VVAGADMLPSVGDSPAPIQDFRVIRASPRVHLLVVRVSVLLPDRTSRQVPVTMATMAIAVPIMAPVTGIVGPTLIPTTGIRTMGMTLGGTRGGGITVLPLTTRTR
jgi:hypothetical protein